MGKTEGSRIRLGRNFGRLNSCKNPLTKVVDFEPLGALSGPGAPDPDLAHFQITALRRVNTKIIEIPVVLLTF